MPLYKLTAQRLEKQTRREKVQALLAAVEDASGDGLREDEGESSGSNEDEDSSSEGAEEDEDGAEDEDLALDLDAEDLSGLEDSDESSDEEEDENEEARGAKGLDTDDEEEGGTSSASSFEITLETALTSPTYLAPASLGLGPSTQLCVICPGRLLKNESMVEEHLASAAHSRAAKRFSARIAEDRPLPSDDPRDVAEEIMKELERKRAEVAVRGSGREGNSLRKPGRLDNPERKRQRGEVERSKPVNKPGKPVSVTSVNAGNILAALEDPTTSSSLTGGERKRKRPSARAARKEAKARKMLLAVGAALGGKSTRPLPATSMEPTLGQAKAAHPKSGKTKAQSGKKAGDSGHVRTGEIEKAVPKLNRKARRLAQGEGLAWPVRAA